MNVNDLSLDRLADFVGHGRLFVLTGAGMSTESGIPDYRLPDGTRRVTPMTISEFRSGDAARQRYWIRSAVGWERFAAAEPNVAHVAVTRLQEAGLVSRLVTQNVDGLHTRAGTRDVVELHGNLASVRCLACDERFSRAWFQGELVRLNPDLPRTAQLLADGDADVDARWERSFRLAACPRCGSTSAKPDVVMFGESVAATLVAECFAALSAADRVLVLGSSLKVMSGYRFVLAARRAAQPVAMVGLGEIRGHEQADLVVTQRLGECLSALTERLGLNGSPAS